MKYYLDGIKTYQLPLKQRISIRPGQSLSSRDLAIVGFKRCDDKFFFGELSPLTGLHSESLDSALKQLKSLLEKIAPSGEFEIDFDINPPIWTKPFFGYFSFEGVYPSVLCAIEQFLWSAYHDIAKTRFSTNVEVAGFVSDPLAKNIDLDGLRACRAIKIKIGRHDLRQEITAITNLKSKLDPAVEIRLDPNQVLSKEGFDALVKVKDTLGIDYLEEPFLDASSYDSLSHELTIALDESIYDRAACAIDKTLMLSLKPGRLGFSTVMAWAALLTDIKKQLVLSSSYESGIGTRYLIQLADFLGVEKPLGIGTYMQLECDLLESALTLSMGLSQIDHKESIPVDWLGD